MMFIFFLESNLPLLFVCSTFVKMNLPFCVTTDSNLVLVLCRFCRNTKKSLAINRKKKFEQYGPVTIAKNVNSKFSPRFLPNRSNPYSSVYRFFVMRCKRFVMNMGSQTPCRHLYVINHDVITYPDNTSPQ